MAELHDHLGGQHAIWVGHDWGCVVVGGRAGCARARAQPRRRTDVIDQPEGHALRTIVSLVDRSIYPADEYPDGQWDYYRYYTTHFDAAVADFDTDSGIVGIDL